MRERERQHERGALDRQRGRPQLVQPAPELGRVYVLITADGDYDSMMTLLDAQNDGEFELIEELDAAEWAARGYNGNDVWTHDFVLWR